MKKVLLLCLSMILLASCVKKADYRKLQVENDALKLENIKSTQEMNEMLVTLNEVEDGFQAIRDAENYLTIQQNAGGEFALSKQEQIRENMQLITETLKKNKEQIAQLEDRVKRSSGQYSAMKKTIDRLSAELDQKTMTIAMLQQDLEKKNVRIQELDQMVTALNEDLENMAMKANVQSQKLSEQEKELNTVYYCFGTSKELKEQKILTGGGLFSKAKVSGSGFNQDYFIAIDKREVREIPLFAEDAQIKSSHPAGSYELVRDQDNNMLLLIIDATAFWSTSNHLVIVVG